MSSFLLFPLCVAQIPAYLRLPGRLRLCRLWPAGPVRGHVPDGVAAVGRGAAGPAGRGVLGQPGRRLLLQRAQ